ncbi:MAG: YoaK family protein, partial [Caulobacteraceae bacterium]
LAIGLSALAGFVDAQGYLHLNGFFVSFMSGNSTRLAVAISQGEWSFARIAAVIVALFVAGVVLGAVVGEMAGRARRRAVLATETLLLAAAAVLQGVGHAPLAIAAVTLAMGAENAVFERDGDISIGLTYMTGTLAKAGQRMANALMGGPPLAWLPYLLLWVGLSAGALLGALAFAWVGLNGLWIAAGVAAVLTVLVTVSPRLRA